MTAVEKIWWKKLLLMHLANLFLRFPNKNSTFLWYLDLSDCLCRRLTFLHKNCYMLCVIVCYCNQVLEDTLPPISGWHCSQFPLYLHLSQSRCRGNPPLTAGLLDGARGGHIHLLFPENRCLVSASLQVGAKPSCIYSIWIRNQLGGQIRGVCVRVSV